MAAQRRRRRRRLAQRRRRRLAQRRRRPTAQTRTRSPRAGAEATLAPAARCAAAWPLPRTQLDARRCAAMPRRAWRRRRRQCSSVRRGPHTHARTHAGPSRAQEMGERGQRKEGANTADRDNYSKSGISKTQGAGKRSSQECTRFAREKCHSVKATKDCQWTHEMTTTFGCT